ncbi:hypothetical protein D3C80_2004110 [compost metagenome]
MTVVITPAIIGFGGCTPPAGVKPANASSVKPPVIKPMWISPRIAPVRVQTMMGRNRNSASSQKSIPRKNTKAARDIP